MGKEKKQKKKKEAKSPARVLPTEKPWRAWSPSARKQAMATFGKEALHLGHTENNQARAHILVQIPIDYYAQQGWLTKRQYDAGEEFHRCWYYGGMRAGAGISKYDTAATGGSRDPLTVIHGVNQELHDKYEKAKHAIRGIVQALICFNVCCIGEWASALSPVRLNIDDFGMPSEDIKLGNFSGKSQQKMAWLKEALDDLADHWRMPR